MKIIKYLMGDERQIEMGECLQVEMTWSEANEEIAKLEAVNGEYTIEDDGQPEPEAEPSVDEILNILLGV